MHQTVTEWWNAISLRTKITGVTVVVLSFGLLIAGVGTVVILRPALADQLNAELVTVATNKVDRYIDPVEGSNGDKVVQDNDQYFIAVFNPAGKLIDHNWDDRSPATRPLLPATPTLKQTIDDQPVLVKNASGTVEYHAVMSSIESEPGSNERDLVFVAVSMRGPDNVVATYLTIFFGLGLGVIVLGALLTRVLVTNTFHPLREVELTAARIADGDFSQRLAGATPNTEVGRLNRSLNTMLSRIDRAFNDRARTIDQMRRFVGDASHELRTPLVTVRGYAELYRMGAIQTPEDVGQAMERIEKEAIRMGGLVEDLLELARLDETKPLVMEPVDLIPIAKDAVMDAKASSPGRTVTFVLDTPPSMPAATAASTPPAPAAEPAPLTQPAKTRAAGTANATGPIALAGATFARLRSRRPRRADAEKTDASTTSSPASALAVGTAPTPTTPPIVMGVENKIRQVVTNLMGNAMRFTAHDSPIEIGVSANLSTRKATISIIDHGEGIPPQIREKIFQRFWRADTSRARETGGSGLGLAIVSSIVHAHNGTVDVTETPGGGATFRVTLPLAEQSLIDTAPRPVLSADDASAS